MTAIGTSIHTLLFGKKVGIDEFNNAYYKSKKDRRWVIYKGTSEASKVPAEWHRWLHKTTDDLPNKDAPHYDWEKSHLPNLTGTDLAYTPPGSIKNGGERKVVDSDYEAWKPE